MIRYFKSFLDRYIITVIKIEENQIFTEFFLN
jgi:hypothetical protein